MPQAKKKKFQNKNNPLQDLPSSLHQELGSGWNIVIFVSVSALT